MSTQAISQSGPVERSGIAVTAGSRAPEHRSLMILALGVCAAAGVIAGSATRFPAVAGGEFRSEAQAAGWPAASAPIAIDGTRAALRELGVRNVAECDAACAARSATSAAPFETAGAQAVIVAGGSADVAIFVHRLRAAGSHAMVVLSSPADPADVVRRLPEAERHWLMVALPAAPGLAVVGRDGSVVD